MSAYIELYVDQGATYNNTIDLADDLTNAPINLSGFIVRSQMRRSYYSANATANITCTITDAANGKILMGLTAANTANIKPGRYVFDLETESAVGTVARVLEGTITITAGVSR